MKKLLPKTSENPQGFTLVELLVVIAIIAILAVIGTAVFSGLQRNARDASRRSEIQAIANAMEANYNTSTNLYTPAAGSMFASGSIPTGLAGAAPYWDIPSATSNTTGYNICAVLEAGGSYCQKSQQR
ncbi:MAG: prepilin-type N-terminal cleavage/methylation domain-containing protein [Microgenomates group bacterium]